MTKRRKIFFGLGMILSFLASGYAGISVVFYSWLNAANSERWPATKAGLWAGGALLLAVLFVCLFVYCLRALIKNANQEYRNEKSST
jgi:1,4-dihydroxy-2-naphthoate octaprenyltransferase